MRWLEFRLLNQAVMFLWLPLNDATPTPDAVEHRIAIDRALPAGREHVEVHGAPAEVRAQSPLVLGAPLRGGPWVGIYDPAMEHGRRTSIYTLDGRARIPARFAIDWIRLDEKAGTASGDASKVANWYGYAADVLAVADGTVADARDDMPALDTVGESQGAMPLENASGNYVVLDVGGGRYVFYEHLKHGSIRVTTGERVQRGQVIGLLGNSGSSSSGPHLHFHVADAAATLAAEGLRYVFDAFEVLGAYESVHDFIDGRLWTPAPGDAGGVRTMELPDANAVVRFGDVR